MYQSQLAPHLWSMRQGLNSLVENELSLKGVIPRPAGHDLRGHDMILHNCTGRPDTWP